MIDARDLGAWLVHLIERKQVGAFNATGPVGRLTWGEWLETCKRVAGSDAAYTWLSDEFLQANEVPMEQLPFWVPEPYDGIFAVSIQRALDAGLTFRPLADTVHDTLEWINQLDRPLRIGLEPEREAELLAAWKEKAVSN
jgi:2'-hydroxyisoflavone reductase